MEAKNIYIATQHMIGKVRWLHADENEWFFVGERGDFKESQVQSLISDFFLDTEIFLVVGRNNAYPVKTKEAAAVVRDNFGSKDITLTSKDIKSFFHFSHVGVARYGTVS